MAIKKDTLHPENEPEVDIYPKTSIDQVENLQANLDALNGDIANVNGEIANISTNVNQNIIDISDIKDDITVLNTAYGSYTDYTEVTNGFLLTYLSGKQIELPIKAGTNVTFSKYPGSNQIIINSTGGSVPDNIALLDTANTFTAQNTFNKLTYYKDNVFFQNIPASFEDSTRKLKLLLNYNGFIKSNRDTGNTYNITFPNQTGTIALTTDIPNTSSFATLAGNNNWTGQNEFPNGITMYGGSFNAEYTVEGARVTDGDYKANYGGRWITTEYQGQSGTINIPQGKSGTMALVEDIPNTSSFATLAGNNNWTGDNIFDGFSKSIRVNGLFQVSGDEEPISATYNQVSYDGFNIAYIDGENQNIFHIGIDFENKARFGFDKYDGSSYNLYIPEKDGTIALLSDIPSTSSFPTLTGNNTWSGKNIFNNGITTGITKYADYITYRQYIFNFPNKNGTLALVEDIPISLMYSSSKLGENSVDFPFNIDKNYFFTITMTNTGESKSFIYAKGTSSTYTIVINSSTSFEVKLDATGSSTRLIFTNKSNTNPFVVRAEISN